MNYALNYPRFWFWYFWVSVALLAISFVTAALNSVSGKGSISEIFGLALSTLAMWPLYGYVRQVRIAPRWLWRVVLVFSGLSLLLVTVLVAITGMKASVFWVLLVPFGVWLVAAPQLFGLYQYIHRSPHIWRDGEA